MNATVAVTGATGFIGKRLVALLESQGKRVLCINRPTYDLLNPQSIRELFSVEKPSTVFHLAATGVTHDRAHDVSVIDENSRMMSNLLEACYANTTFVIAGSMAEYGASGILREDGPFQPQTAYAIAKLAANQIALSYGSKKHAIRIARLFGVYGPGEPAFRLFPSLLRNIKAGRSMPLSDGMQTRDFVHVDDVCDGLCRLAFSQLPSNPLEVNLGTGVGVRIRDVATHLCEALGGDLSLLQFGDRERSPGDADVLVADTERLERLLDWVPPSRLNGQLSLASFTGTEGRSLDTSR